MTKEASIQSLVELLKQKCLAVSFIVEPDEFNPSGGGYFNKVECESKTYDAYLRFTVSDRDLATALKRAIKIAESIE